MPVSAPVLPRFLQAEDAASHSFSNLFTNAQTSPEPKPSEIAGPNTLPTRKAIVPAKQSSDPQTAKPGDRGVAVQTVPLQPPPIFLSLFLAISNAADQAPDSNSVPGGVSANTNDSTGGPAVQSGTDPLPQLAPPPSPVAFSLNLQKPGLADQKPGGAEHHSTDRIQGGQPSASPPSQSSSNEQGSSSDTGSRQSQSAPEANMPTVLKPGTPSEIKPSVGPAEIPALTGSPVQGFASAPTSSGTQQVFSRATSEAAPVATMETPAPSVPVSARQIDLTVPNDAGHQVDIRISQRGSDVQVTVRTPDGDLAQSLRHNLPELSANLSRNGLREEAVHTAQSHTAGDGDRETSQNNNSRQQSGQDPEDKQRATQGRLKNRQAVSFAEIIHTEKRSI
jgi:hypothetical protein